MTGQAGRLAAQALRDDRPALLSEGRTDVLIDQDPENEMRAALRRMASLLGRGPGRPGDGPTSLPIHMRENA